MRLITVDGVTKNMAEWAKEIGVSASTILKRYRKNVSIHKPRRKEHQGKFHKIFGKSVKELAVEKGVSEKTIRRRYNKYGSIQKPKLIKHKQIKSRSKFYRLFGKSTKELAAEEGVTVGTIRKRYKKHGFIHSPSISIFPGRNSKARACVINRVIYSSVIEAGEKLNMSHTIVYGRIHRGEEGYEYLRKADSKKTIRHKLKGLE